MKKAARQPTYVPQQLTGKSSQMRRSIVIETIFTKNQSESNSTMFRNVTGVSPVIVESDERQDDKYVPKPAILMRSKSVSFPEKLVVSGRKSARSNSRSPSGIPRSRSSPSSSSLVTPSLPNLDTTHKVLDAGHLARLIDRELDRLENFVEENFSALNSPTIVPRTPEKSPTSPKFRSHSVSVLDSVPEATESSHKQHTTTVACDDEDDIYVSSHSNEFQGTGESTDNEATTSTRRISSNVSPRSSQKEGAGGELEEQTTYKKLRVSILHSDSQLEKRGRRQSDPGSSSLSPPPRMSRRHSTSHEP